MPQTRQSRPDSAHDLQAKILKTFEGVASHQHRLRLQDRDAGPASRGGALVLHPQEKKMQKNSLPRPPKAVGKCHVSVSNKVMSSRNISISMSSRSCSSSSGEVMRTYISVILYVLPLSTPDTLSRESISSQFKNQHFAMQFRGGLVFKAHRLVYHSTLGWS
jgi:hypothetical protein